MYFMVGWARGIIGLSLSYIIRHSLAHPRKRLRGHRYNVVVTSHALIIIFFMVIPTLIGGYGNLLIPLQVGLGDLVLPRLNILRFRLLLPALVLIVTRIGTEGGAGTS